MAMRNYEIHQSKGTSREAKAQKRIWLKWGSGRSKSENKSPTSAADFSHPFQIAKGQGR